MRGRGGGWVAAQFVLMAAVLGAGLVPPAWPDAVQRARTIVGVVLAAVGIVCAVWAGRTLGRVREVADATREQSAASISIAQRVETIAQMVEETSSTIRGTAETANQLERIAQGLKAQIGRFRV